MSKPVFRLASVLRLREHELDRARADLRAAMDVSERWHGAQAEALRQIGEGSKKLSAKLAEGIDAGRFGIVMDAIDAVRRRAESAGRELAAGRHAVNQAREVVAAARGKVRALEILRERRESEFAAAEQHREQLVLDELGVRATESATERS